MVKEGLLYTKDHEWARCEGDIAVVGITDYAQGEMGDIVFWHMARGCFRLIRKSDNKELFATAPVNGNGLLRSTGKPPKLTGMVASVKSKGWFLEIE